MEVASFQLRLTGDLADHHEFEGYDGYMALAGAAWTLSLATNYVETGGIRHRGNFPGRRSVRAMPLARGSVVADFAVILHSQPAAVFGLSALGGGASALLYGVVNRVLTRNLGISRDPLNADTAALLQSKDGDIEALVAISEPSVRQAHDVIGNGANEIEWIGGHSAMASLNQDTKAYIKASIPDLEIIERDVSVSGFYGNSGHESVFDFNLGRNVPISMPRDILRQYGTFFSWGLHQYLNHTGLKVRIRFTRILAMDGRPKRYVIVSAREAKG
ncbi:hypothetical protein [Sphingomonas pruni]|uniref:DUF7946 domain-containing protein n=1 Tax=Sphingomonas pruni TaxID=40683 RepID=UPI000A4AC030|nr:hypothetical protein [Sphingomonas pruni]